MNDRGPIVKYEPADKDRVVAVLIGGNGEVQMRTEAYSNKANADRGLAEITRSLLFLVAAGEIDMRRAT